MGSVRESVSGAGYSFAVEYDGPPLGYDLPRAVPINVERIPVAAVVATESLSRKLSLPVVQPIFGKDVLSSKKFSKELSFENTVSPTSVIGFADGIGEEGNVRGSESFGSALGAKANVSPDSVIALERGSNSNNGCEISGELSNGSGLEFTTECYGSSELSDAINDSRELGSSSISHELSRELVGRTGSPGNAEFSGSLGKSNELLGSSSASRYSSGFKESMDFNELNPPDWASTGSPLSLEYPSSRISSLRAEDCNNLHICNGKRAPVVTFRSVDSEDAPDEDLSYVEALSFRGVKEPEVKARKGACYRCLKGNRFTEKEVCIVCDAKFCGNCVLRAMGSMPEGRKCVTCIGSSIDESKRGNLGKCSRLLKRLLNELEVQHIMKAEKSCEVNQLPPEHICVNGKPLCQEELVLLQTCPNPPKKLVPGNYWYDKVSGLWGKERQKPSRIITPHLNVGGPIDVKASNGNTAVFINGREITKTEMRMLQLAGVQCVGSPHFWLNEDGSYQEEGQKNTKGYIWGKAGTRFVCALLSLPVPSKSANSWGEPVSDSFNRNLPAYLEQRTLQKLLLVGSSGSGTSTIFKQVKILYKTLPFPEDECENIKSKIQSNVFIYLGILLEGRERFEDESLTRRRKKELPDPGDSDENDSKTVYSIGLRLKAFSDWLLKTMASGSMEAIFPAASREYAPLVEELWNDPAIQATYRRRSELESFPSVASFFLEKAGDILRTDYEPSNMDILYADGVTSSNGLSFVDFTFPQSSCDFDTADQHDLLSRYQLIRVNARGFGESCKWLEMFEDVRVVMFCVALSDYDQFCIDGSGSLSNKMLASCRLFETIVAHPTFEHMDFLLLLTKYDLFEEKVEQVPLTRCDWFSDFQPVVSRNRSNSHRSTINKDPTLGQLGFHYIAVKFKKLFASLTGRKLYVSPVKGLEPNSVDEALKYAKEIMKWDEERTDFSLSEYSVYSSSFSN